jgi:hypothetical protein
MNYPPDKPQLVSPADNEPYLSVYNVYLNVTVIDLNDDNMSVEFYWADDTFIGTITPVLNDTQASCFLPDFLSPDWLTHDTTYEWYAISNDTIVTNQSDTWSFNTSHYTDINEDGAVNYLDVSIMVSYYRQYCTPGQYGWDIIRDGRATYLDISALVSDFGQSFP